MNMGISKLMGFSCLSIVLSACLEQEKSDSDASQEAAATQVPNVIVGTVVDTMTEENTPPDTPLEDEPPEDEPSEEATTEENTELEEKNEGEGRDGREWQKATGSQMGKGSADFKIHPKI